MKSSVCVTGGAGYVGSQTVWALRDRGVPVVVYDNLSTGHREHLPPDVPVVVGDVRDEAALQNCFAKHKVRAVVHCAAVALVGESMRAPSMYWSINVGGTAALTGAAMACGVKAIVFSSSAAVYGEALQIPINERHPKEPINPYGRSKHVAEQVLEDARAAGGPAWIAFRYFNAAGGDSKGRTGEDHEPETHLIPNILKVAQSMKQGGVVSPVKLFGGDYPTEDGTCERDYIHTEDLAEAHIRGVEYLLAGGQSGAFNLGTGQGRSLLAMVRAARTVTGVDIPYQITARRPGDPAQLVADADLAWQELGWRAKNSSLRHILDTAWRWMQRGDGA